MTELGKEKGVRPEPQPEILRWPSASTGPKKIGMIRYSCATVRYTRNLTTATTIVKPCAFVISSTDRVWRTCDGGRKRVPTQNRLYCMRCLGSEIPLS